MQVLRPTRFLRLQKFKICVCGCHMANLSARRVDNILLTLGATGRYQLLQALVAYLAVIPSAFQLLSNVFTSHTVPCHCSAPPDEGNISLLTGQAKDVNVTYLACDIVLWRNGSVYRKESCMFGVDYELPVYSSAVSQFDLVCERASLGRLTQTLVIAGQGLGAFTTAFISDRLGRKRVLVMCNLGMMVSGIIVAYAPNYVVFAVFKFIVGACQQGTTTTIVTLVLELLPTKVRRYHATVFGLSFAFGTMLMSLLAYLFKDLSWRTLQLVFSLSSLPVFLQMWYLDESLRWLIANGRSKRAIAVISRAAKVNRKHVDEVLQAHQLNDSTADMTEGGGVVMSSTSSMEAGASIAQDSTRKLTLLDLLRVRRLLGNAAIMWFAWFTTALGFFVLYLTSTSLSGNRFLNFFLTALMEVPSTLVLHFTLNRFGRKPISIVFFALLGMGLLAAGVFRYLETRNSVFSTLTLMAYLVAMFGASGSFSSVFIYTPEMFPTNLRGQAMGVSSCMGRVGGMLAPFTGVLAQKAIWSPGLLIGCCACLVCLLLICLPETNGRELPQTIEDLHHWLKKGDDQQNGHAKLLQDGDGTLSQIAEKKLLQNGDEKSLQNSDAKFLQSGVVKSSDNGEMKWSENGSKCFQNGKGTHFPNGDGKLPQNGDIKWTPNGEVKWSENGHIDVETQWPANV